MLSTSDSSGFVKAYKKVKKGKKKLSDKDFIKYKSTKDNNLNSLGKFFLNENVSKSELGKIAYDYNNKKYKLTPYTCVVLPKSGGGFRSILVPAPRDRILFSFLLAKIKTRFLKDINFYNVFGSGERSDFPNLRKIIEQIRDVSKESKFILKIDICKYFPSIDQKQLALKMQGYIEDEYIFNLIFQSFNNKIKFKFEKNFSLGKKIEVEDSVKKGIPQGCAYSPLLANFYALDMDACVKNEGYASFRYLDDMIIFTQTQEEAERIFSKIKLVATDLKLKIHDITEKKNNKTYIQPANHTFEYLGIEVKSNGDFEIPLSKIKKEVDLIKKEIFNLHTIKKFGADKVLGVLTAQLKGWRNYYRINFPSAYNSLIKNEYYNNNLKNYYKKQLYSNRFIKNKLKKANFDIDDKKYYL